MKRNKPVNPTGRLAFVRKGLPPDFWADLYHVFIKITWPRLMAFFVLTYVGANLLFAGLYLLQDEALSGVRPGSFPDAFFFSVQTMATIGYGKITPITTYANMLATAEAFIGLMGFAMATGMMFAKFSRPSARVMFAEKALMTRYEGHPAFQFRMGNARGNQIVEAGLTAVVLKNEVTAEGIAMRRMYDIHFVRNNTPVFALTWMVTHIIDEKSPFQGETHETLAAKDAEVFVVISGIDETISQNVHARHSYFMKDQVEWNRRYADVFGKLPDGTREIDFTKFHETLPLA